MKKGSGKGLGYMGKRKGRKGRRWEKREGTREGRRDGKSSRQQQQSWKSISITGHNLKNYRPISSDL